MAASLTFGGRPVVGVGFGIPLMRYVLEVCETVSQACRVFERVPVHAAQNVTVLDRSGDFATIRLSPDRAPEVLTVPVATNHQHPGDWPAYAAAVQTHEREHRRLELLQTPQMTRATGSSRRSCGRPCTGSPVTVAARSTPPSTTPSRGPPTTCGPRRGSPSR